MKQVGNTTMIRVLTTVMLGLTLSNVQAEGFFDYVTHPVDSFKNGILSIKKQYELAKAPKAVQELVEMLPEKGKKNVQNGNQTKQTITHIELKPLQQAEIIAAVDALQTQKLIDAGVLKPKQATIDPIKAEQQLVFNPQDPVYQHLEQAAKLQKQMYPQQPVQKEPQPAVPTSLVPIGFFSYQNLTNLISNHPLMTTIGLASLITAMYLYNAKKTAENKHKKRVLFVNEEPTQDVYEEDEQEDEYENKQKHYKQNHREIDLLAKNRTKKSPEYHSRNSSSPRYNY